MTVSNYLHCTNKENRQSLEFLFHGATDSIRVSLESRLVPRAARVVAVGALRHLTQSGNNRQRNHPSQQDYQVYLALLAERARQYECRLLGDCLMPNHVHLVVIPNPGAALALALGRVHNAFSRDLKCRLSHSGHLWQTRFYSAPLSRHPIRNRPARTKRTQMRLTRAESTT